MKEKTFILSQWIYDTLSKSQSHNFFNTPTRYLSAFLRKVLVRTVDPLVSYSLGPYLLKIPLSHELGIYQKLYPNYSWNIGRIAGQIKEKYHELTIIDIGANVGDTVAILRNFVSSPILAIEGNPHFYKLLKDNCRQFKNVTLVSTLIGDKNEFSLQALVQEKGSSHLKQTSSSSRLQFTRLEDLLRIYPQFLGAKLLKIDTDGFEAKILRGSKDWLAQTQPVLFFEYDPAHLERYQEDGLVLLNQLSQAGYTTLLVYLNTGEYMSCVELNNTKAIKDLHEYFSGKENRMYADICAFSAQDMDLAQAIKQQETQRVKIKTP